jgi:hypothetical protein
MFVDGKLSRSSTKTPPLNLLVIQLNQSKTDTQICLYLLANLKILIPEKSSC